MKWRPIETAPSDDRILGMRLNLKHPNLPKILWIKIMKWERDYRDGYRTAWREDANSSVDAHYYRLAPTHWAPLPDLQDIAG